MARPPVDIDFVDPEPDPLLVASGRDTIVDQVQRSGRKSGATPIRRSFVQPLDRKRRAHGGPLAELVRRRDLRALVLYLLALTLASKQPWDVRRDAHIWARALDLGTGRSGREAISKAWRRLRDLSLVTTSREGRKSVVTMLREDGSGKPYAYPEPDPPEDRYLRLPEAFWLDGWYQKLSLPGIAMLLVLLAEKDDVVLPIDQIPKWYGISRASAQRGLVELRDHGLLTMWVVQRPEPSTAQGFTFERHHRLRGAFERPAVEDTDATVTVLKTSAAKRRRNRRQTAAKTSETNGSEVIEK